MKIESYAEKHWPPVWAILEPIFRAGETYPFVRDISEEQARTVWIDSPAATYVAIEEGQVLGTFYIKPNQPSLGAHICNCGYAVAIEVRGNGVAAQMCQFSQEEARRLGYSAMQYNLVVSSNKSAVDLWLRQGFEIVGKIPNAFQHARLGHVDAFVMYKDLAAE